MKLTKTQKFTIVFGALCLLAATHSAIAAAASTYVGVAAGNTFAFTAVRDTNDTTTTIWPGTYDMTLTIDNVTDNTGNATVGMHYVLKNATWTSAFIYESETIYEDTTDTDKSDESLVINTKVVNKTYTGYFTPAGELQWFNASWDGNGVLTQMSRLFITGGVVTSFWSFTRAGIPGYPVMFLVAFTAVAVGLIVKKKLRSV